MEVNIGDEFGKLTVISEPFYVEVGTIRKRRKKVKVRCKCGREYESFLLSIRKGKDSICKHCRNTGNRKNGNKNNTNRYIIKEDIVEIHTKKGDIIIIDRDDFDLVKKYCWHVNYQGYAMTQIDKKKILMHRLLLNILDDKDILIDHKNRNRLDNRKSNLSKVRHRENSQNTKIYINNKSGVKGVVYDKNIKKYRSYISIDYKRIYGGNFDTLDEAALNRNKLEEKYFDYFNIIKQDIQKTLKENKIIEYI